MFERADEIRHKKDSLAQKTLCITYPNKEVPMNECICIELNVDVKETLEEIQPVLEQLSEHPIRDFLDRYNN